MHLWFQPGSFLITDVTLNTGRWVCWAAAPPDPALRQQIQSILRRGVGRVPGLTRSYVSVSFDAGCAQVLFMRRLEELLLMGLAWGPGASSSLWEWLRCFSGATEGVCPTPAAIQSWPEPAPMPWRARFYCSSISSLTPREAATFATFQRDLALTLIDSATSQN
jgi:hypothetical protein